MKRLISFILLALAAFTHAADPARINGFIVAGHAWTWGKGTVFEAIDVHSFPVCPLVLILRVP